MTECGPAEPEWHVCCTPTDTSPTPEFPMSDSADSRHDRSTTPRESSPTRPVTGDPMESAHARAVPRKASATPPHGDKLDERPASDTKDDFPQSRR